MARVSFRIAYFNTSLLPTNLCFFIYNLNNRKDSTVSIDDIVTEPIKRANYKLQGKVKEIE